MIITISGKPGSGKSTVAKEIAKRLHLKHYSMGDFQREIAERRCVSITELGRLEEKDKSIDEEVDRRQKELGKKEDNFVIDSRMGFHFIPNSIRIFLDVEFDVGAERIFGQKRREEKFANLEDAKKELKRRVESERKRYREYYGVDHYDMKKYDFAVDTTDKDVEGVVKEIIKEIKSKNNNKKQNQKQ